MTVSFTGVAASFYPKLNLYRLEAFNISNTFKQRTFTFFRNMKRKGTPIGKVTQELIEKYKEEILKTPPAHFTDVIIDLNAMVKIVTMALSYQNDSARETM